MAAVRLSSRETPKSLKQLRDERNMIRTSSVCKATSTQSRLDLITKELDSLRSTVEPYIRKETKAAKSHKKYKPKALNISTCSANSLLEKAAALSVSLEGKGPKLCVNLCETSELDRTSPDNLHLNETSLSVQSTAKIKRTLLRTPSVLKSTSSSSTPRTSISSPIRLNLSNSSFIFGKTLQKKQKLVDQAAEILTSLKAKSPSTPITRIPSEIKLDTQPSTTKVVSSVYPLLFKSSRLPKPSGQFKKAHKR
mmetsp:Transcript_5819/g.10371  ORF Transcript_5819/g.10371 Transcript_5819/m.10371 type:complete len:252 (+) Transcript_5819:586-1341(+)